MKTFAVLALIACAGAANATMTITSQPLEGGTTYQERNTVVYTGIPGTPNYSAFPAATGNLGFDDYQSTMAGNFDNIIALRFVGGVTAIGGIIDINFYDSAANPLSSIAIQLPLAGPRIWTISGFAALGAKNGFMELVARDGTTAQWFLTAAAPTVGTNQLGVGGAGTTLNHAFELTVPAPSALALLGMGGIIAGRRRR